MALPSGSTRRRLGAVLAVGAMAGAVIACGSSSETRGEALDAPDPASFPPAAGRTLQEIATEVGQADLVVAPAGQTFHRGPNRLGFAVFTVDREPVTDAEVAIYAARPEGPAEGPFTAAVHTLETDAAFRSENTATDPEAAEVIYAADLELDGKGEWQLLAVVRDSESELGATLMPSAVVGRFEDVPAAGEKAPVVNTPTVEDAGGDPSKIDTRRPPSSMHDVDLAEAIGKQPVVLLFATPALCTSRVCGPVVDIAEQVKSERPDDAAFIHMEIYEDNVIAEDNLRPQVEAYNLPSEPWLFVVDERGRISTAIEGAFSADELNEALDRLAGAETS
jgi:hypothetical protein